MPVQGRHPDRDLAEKWRVIGTALEDNGKTLRLCLILLVITLPTAIIAVGAIVMALTAPR